MITIESKLSTAMKMYMDMWRTLKSLRVAYKDVTAITDHPTDNEG